MKNKLGYTPNEIAQGLYLQGCYKLLIKAVRDNKPLKDVKWVRDDLKKQFSKLTVDEINQFDDQVQTELSHIENRNEIKRLRNRISKMYDKIKALNEESGEDDLTPKEINIKEFDK